MQWQIGVLKLEAVHGRAAGAGMVVAVVDSGVDASHPDLKDQVLQGPDFRANVDVDGRGTGLAGLVAGKGHSPTGASFLDYGEAGIVGVAPAAKILPIAFAPSAGEVGDPDELASGIELAVSRGARIVCIGRGTAPSERLQFAVKVATERGVLVVTPESAVWPASYPGVLTSIPADRAGNVVQPPVVGRTTGIVVPGVDLMTTDRAGLYRVADTSASAAMLAGAAAVAWSVNPQASAAQVMQWLRTSATDRGAPGPDGQFGVGDLNLVGALDAAVAKPSAPAQAPAAEAPAASAQPPVGAAALFDSRDWRRWLVVLPLVLFLAGLGLWSFLTARSRVRART